MDCVYSLGDDDCDDDCTDDCNNDCADDCDHDSDDDCADDCADDNHWRRLATVDTGDNSFSEQQLARRGHKLSSSAHFRQCINIWGNHT